MARRLAGLVRSGRPLELVGTDHAKGHAASVVGRRAGALALAEIRAR
jgi:hypothetical protein